MTQCVCRVVSRRVFQIHQKPMVLLNMPIVQA